MATRRSIRCARWERVSTGARTASSRRSRSAAVVSPVAGSTSTIASGQVKTAIVLAGLQADGHDRGGRARAQPRPHRADARGALGARSTESTTARPGSRRALRRRSSSTCPATRRRPRSSWWPRASPRARDRARGRVPQPGAASVSSTCCGAWARTIEVDADGRASSASRSATSGGRASPLVATTIAADEAIIDEIPVLAVAAAFADGVTEIHDAAELRGEGERPHRHGRAGARRSSGVGVETQRRMR